MRLKVEKFEMLDETSPVFFTKVITAVGIGSDFQRIHYSEKHLSLFPYYRAKTRANIHGLIVFITSEFKAFLEMPVKHVIWSLKLR